MKRRGFLFLDAVLALGLTAVMAAAVFPAAARAARGADEMERRLHLSETAFFACDYITDRIRHSLKRAAADDLSGGAFRVAAVAADGRVRPYRFLVSGNMWRLELYTGRTQPITGGEAVSIDVRPLEGAPYFRQDAGGLVHLAYGMRRQGETETFAVETAVLPLYDFFRVGEPYE